MTTYEAVQSFRSSTRTGQLRARVRTLKAKLQGWTDYVLPVTGLGLFTSAAATWHVWAALVVAGGSAFALDYLRGAKEGGNK